MSSFVRRSGGGRVGALAAHESTGVAELDNILGGGVPPGKLVIVLEDKEAPHHLLLLRYFIAQGLNRKQPILFGSSLASPNAFLATLPGQAQSHCATSNNNSNSNSSQLRIAWQYHKYEGDDEGVSSACSFDLRSRRAAAGDAVECMSFQGTKVERLLQHTKTFFCSKASTSSTASRVAMHSLCSPQQLGEESSCSEWDWLCYVLHLKALISRSNAVGLITIPATLLHSSLSTHWQHLADVLLCVEPLDDEQSQVLADAVGLLHVRKLSSPNTQVPSVPQSASYAIKIVKKKQMVLEPLHSAPVQGAASASCTSGSTGY